MSTICIIPARSGSKGIKDKNIQKLNNKSLIEIAVGQANQCPSIDDVYISTDSDIYEEIALKSGAKSIGLRPEKLSGDEVKTSDVIIDFIEKLNRKINLIVVLQPTSPIRQISDIEICIKKCKNKQVDSCVSVSKLEEPHPFKLKQITSKGYLEPLIEGTSSEIPRQLLPEVYALNGAIYVVKSNIILKNRRLITEKTIPHIMSHNYNIDHIQDLERIRFLLKSRKLTL